MASPPLRAAACAALLALAVAGCADSGDPAADDDPSDRSAAADDAPAPSATETTGGTDTGADTGTTGADPSGHSGLADDDGIGPPWCAPEALTASLRALEPAAGNRYAALVLTNSSDVACRTQGWPGLQLTTGDGEAIPTTTVRDRTVNPDRLTILPGGTAWAQLHWSVVPSAEDPADGDCGPAPAALEVIPPEEYTGVTAEWDLGEVCGAGRIETLPLAAGQGPR
ncbi:DUF4232 domain-containing protein [Streptomyces sp. URMC 129]|uniref:DUF4232 domain-containing protein n=1 Tax=Streptomyces sp. URMC 129 TaxID=3423407 RepID=UPI003F1C7308